MLDVIAVVLQVFAFLDTVWTVMGVAGVVGAAMVVVGLTAIVRANRTVDEILNEVSEPAQSPDDDLRAAAEAVTRAKA